MVKGKRIIFSGKDLSGESLLGYGDSHFGVNTTKTKIYQEIKGSLFFLKKGKKSFFLKKGRKSFFLKKGKKSFFLIKRKEKKAKTKKIEKRSKRKQKIPRKKGYPFCT